MKDKTKIALGILSGMAVGIGIGVALSNEKVMDMMMERFDEAKGLLGESINDVLEEHKDMIADLKEKFISMDPMPGPSA